MTDEPIDSLPQQAFSPSGEDDKKTVVTDSPVLPDKDIFIFSKGSLKKKFRLSEVLSEKIITGVAFLSITIIVLIFIFVFKETLPIFRSSPERKAATALTGKQENYRAVER